MGSATMQDAQRIPGTTRSRESATADEQDTEIDLHRAATKGHARAVQKRLDEDVSADAKDSTGDTPLHLAVREGHETVVKLLLNRGANIDATGRGGLTALHIAAMTQDPKMVAMLLEKGANLDPYAGGFTPLHFAVIGGEANVVRLLLEHGANVEAKTLAEAGRGETALHAAVASWNHSLLQLLLENSAEVDARAENPEGQTALHLAAELGNEEAIRTLLNWGANISARYTNGEAALHRAAFTGQLNMVSFLLDRGVDVLAESDIGDTPICMAALGGHDEVVELLLKRAANAMSEAQKARALISAALVGELEVTETLIRAGFAVDAKEEAGLTALKMAARGGHEDAVVLLLRKGADTKSRDSFDMTAADWASMEGHSNVVRLLQEAERQRQSNPRAQLFPERTGSRLANPMKQARLMARTLSIYSGKKIISAPSLATSVCCRVCLDLNFRRGILRSSEVVHEIDGKSLATASAGCAGCRFLYNCLTRLMSIYGDLLWKKGSITGLVLQSVTEGGPLLVYCSTEGSSFNMTRITTRMEIYAHAGSPTMWPVIGTSREVDSAAWSTQRSSIARQFLRECTTGHSHCAYQIGPLPTRVIDVGSNDVDPHLYISKREPAKYLTLSHCWGGSSPITTTTGTIEERKRRIRYDDLPKTFRDAVMITRSLGIQYLWIDSLCILQDSSEDWEKEAGNMKDVYADCYAMISADDSANCHGGCFVAKTAAGQRSFSVDCFGPGMRSSKAYVRLTNVRDPFQLEVCHRLYDPQAFPTRRALDQRGWTLQERILAPRILHFGMSELGWECREKLACECQTVSTDIDKESRFKALLIDYAFRAVPSGNSGHGTTVDVWLWANIVEEFTQRQLTKDTDVLHALSGLASRMSPRGSATEYICGMWRQEIVRFLMWMSDYAQDSHLVAPQPFRISSPLPANSAASRAVPRRHKGYYAPSWSWASVIGPIRYMREASELDNEEQLPRIPKDGTVKRDDQYDIECLVLEVLDIDYEPGLLNPFGPPHSASLTVRGYVAPATWESKDKEVRVLKSSNGGRLVHMPTNPYRGRSISADFEPDVPDEDLEVSLGDSLLLLFVRENRISHDGSPICGWTQPSVVGLVLQPVAGGTDGREIFRRVGVFQALGTEKWERWRDVRTAQDLTLI